MFVLTGVRVVVTRAAHQSQGLVERLRQLGAEVVALPLIEVAPPADCAPLEKAAKYIDHFDWIVFSSVNAVNAVAQYVTLPAGPRGKIAAIGPATAAAIRKLNWNVSLQPDRFVAEDLASRLPANMEGQQVLLPIVSGGRELVANALQNRGAVVTAVEAYVNRIPRDTCNIAPSLLQGMHEKDWILFASPSAVEHLVDVAGRDGLRRTNILTIGPSTSECVRRLGLKVTAEASSSTADGMIDALLQRIAKASGDR